MSDGTYQSHLFLRLIINMSHPCKLRNRKKILENLRKFISLERQLRKFTLMLLSKIQMKKYVCKKPKRRKFWNIEVASFKISSLDSLGVKSQLFFPIFHKRVFRFIKHFQMFNITFRIKEKLGTRRFFTVKT